MNTIERLLGRRSIRKFKGEPIDSTVLNNILEAGRLSPTATNSQPWHFVIIQDEKGKEACTFGGFNKFALDADVVVLGIYRRSEAIMEQYSFMDVTIALQSMVITAWMQGVGSCWIGAFDEPKLRKTLNLPDDAIVVGAITFGIPTEIPPSPKKKQASQVFHYGQW